jgi:cysteinyl-tRNA synthetase
MMPEAAVVLPSAGHARPPAPTGGPMRSGRPVTLSLRNTLSRRVEPVVPLEAADAGQPPQIRMYTCGPTVYRYAHVGNLRSFLLADLVRRVLLYHGLDVLHVKNITDVGHMRDERFDRGADRMLVAAQLEKKSTAEIADAYEAAFHADEAAVNILPAHVFPRATDHIPEMLELAERLEELGYAYATPEGTVYYSVARFGGYGRLSGNSLDELRAGHRAAVEPDKRDPADFALWKHAEEGRTTRWPTRRWGEGYPGWHLECSAMARRYLGDVFEIHTGGIDNVFPHHEDEIAQTAPIVGRAPARHWVHGEFLLMSGRKMAKSAGNFQRITELADEGLDPLGFRYLALTARYGRPLNYSDESLAGAEAGLASLRARLRALGPPPEGGPWAAPEPLVAGRAADRPVGSAEGAAGHGRGDGRHVPEYPVSDRAHAPQAPLTAAGMALHGRFVAALDDDLDMPGALACVREMLRAPISADERRWLVLDADAVLGLDLHRVWEQAAPTQLPADVERLLVERTRARAARDYTRADGLRSELEALGYDVIDRPDGTTTLRWSRH